MSETNELPALPLDIVVDILSRLPVPSLCRFRCVSKLWKSLIQSRKFIETHIQKSTGAQENLRVLMSAYGGWSINCESNDDNIRAAIRFSVFGSGDLFRSRDESDYLELDLVGSSNGLLCIFLDYFNHYILWNPSTGMYWRVCEDDAAEIVSGDESCIDELPFFMYLYGFGYDSVIDDYKIVRVTIYDYPVEEVEVMIINVGRNELRRTRDWIDGDFVSALGLFHNGTLHGREKVDSVSRILTFNLREEKFADDVILLPLPDHDRTSTCIGSLMVVGGKFSIVIRRDAPDGLDHRISIWDEIWVMEEYGVRSSWTKKFVLPCQSGPERKPFTPLCWSNGLMLVAVGDEEIMVYDPEKKDYMEFDLPGKKELLDVMDRVVYIESLVSPCHFRNPSWKCEDILNEAL